MKHHFTFMLHHKLHLYSITDTRLLLDHFVSAVIYLEKKTPQKAQQEYKQYERWFFLFAQEHRCFHYLFFTASANVCNVALMRHNELSEGIDVLDSNGNVVGSSRIAAKHVSDSVTNSCVLLQL